MRHDPLSRMLAAACWAALMVLGGPTAHASDTPAAERLQPAPPVATLAGFVENRGQWPSEVLFFARQNGIEATLTRDALVFRPRPDWDAEQQRFLPRPAPLVLHLPVAGAVSGQGPLPTNGINPVSSHVAPIAIAA